MEKGIKYIKQIKAKKKKVISRQNSILCLHQKKKVRDKKVEQKEVNQIEFDLFNDQFNIKKCRPKIYLFLSGAIKVCGYEPTQLFIFSFYLHLKIIFILCDINVLYCSAALVFLMQNGEEKNCWYVRAMRRQACRQRRIVIHKSRHFFVVVRSFNLLLANTYIWFEKINSNTHTIIFLFFFIIKLILFFFYEKFEGVFILSIQIGLFEY